MREFLEGLKSRPLFYIIIVLVVVATLCITVLIVNIAIKDGANAKSTVVLVETDRGYPLLVRADDQYIGQYIQQHRNYKSYMDDLYEHFVKPGSVVVDVGAEYGYRSVMMAKQMGTIGKLYAIESRDDIFKLLQYNMRLNLLPTVVLMNKTIYSKTGPIILEVPTNNVSASRIISQERAEKLKKTDTLFNVQAYSLDELLRDVVEIDVLRLATHGSELEVLVGARKLMERSPDITIFMTWNASLLTEHSNISKLIQELTDLGFNFWNIEQDGKIRILSRKQLLKDNNIDVVITKKSL